MPLLEELAVHFPDRATFSEWRTSVQTQLFGGALKVQGIWRDDALEGALLVETTGGVSTVVAAVGRLEAGLEDAMAALQASAGAIVWDEATGPDWAERLAPLGFKGFARQTFHQDLHRVEFRDTPELGLAIAPWDDRHRAETVELLAAANAGTLDGLFLTLPVAPSREACAACLDRLLKGEEGDFLPWASWVATEGEALRGVLLCVQGESGQGVLFELAVHPLARGKNLSRRLVHTMQRSLLSRGYHELLFLTTSENHAVHRLFRREEEITAYEESRGGFWIARG